MSTVIRPDISKRSKYWISKERFYELKHFCLQYEEWKEELNSITLYSAASVRSGRKGCSNPTENNALRQLRLLDKISLVESVARETDSSIAPYILKAVTSDVSYPYLQMVLGIPCGRDMFYDRYRKFFWLLSKRKEE